MHVWTQRETRCGGTARHRHTMEASCKQAIPCDREVHQSSGSFGAAAHGFGEGAASGGGAAAGVCSRCSLAPCGQSFGAHLLEHSTGRPLSSPRRSEYRCSCRRCAANDVLLVPSCSDATSTCARRRTLCTDMRALGAPVCFVQLAASVQGRRWLQACGANECATEGFAIALPAADSDIHRRCGLHVQLINTGSGATAAHAQNPGLLANVPPGARVQRKPLTGPVVRLFRALRLWYRQSLLGGQRYGGVPLAAGGLSLSGKTSIKTSF